MKIRIDNIECRFSHGRYDIIKWYPNDYYGKEEKMIEEEEYDANYHFNRFLNLKH
jgi:hypothetical protein